MRSDVDWLCDFDIFSIRKFFQRLLLVVKIEHSQVSVYITNLLLFQKNWQIGYFVFNFETLTCKLISSLTEDWRFLCI